VTIGNITCNQLILLGQIYRGHRPQDGEASCGTYQEDLQMLHRLGLIQRCFLDGVRIVNSPDGDLWNTTDQGAQHVKRCLKLCFPEAIAQLAEGYVPGELASTPTMRTRPPRTLLGIQERLSELDYPSDLEASPAKSYKIDYGCEEWQNSEEFETKDAAIDRFNAIKDEPITMGLYPMTYMMLRHKGETICDWNDESDDETL
jgi:hypothetical protein